MRLDMWELKDRHGLLVLLLWRPVQQYLYMAHIKDKGTDDVQQAASRQICQTLLLQSEFSPLALSAT
jgi:hypothetical protein